MSKEVILMEDVEGLGAQGEVVKVADGYARNYLLPKQLAASVTAGTRRQLEKKQQEREKDLASQRVGAEALAKTIEQTSCTITVKAGAEGKLFGSVSAADIAAALKDQGVELDRTQIVMDGPLRELGVFTVPVKLHPDITATFKVWVVEE